MVAIEQIGAPAFTLRVCPDGKFRYLDVNAAYLARSGMALADVVGRTPYDIHDLLTAAWLSEFYQDAVNRRCPVEYDLRFTQLLGELWWRTALTPVISTDGSIGTLLGICQDVTTEKRLEAELIAKNQQLDTALRMLKGATWQFDLHAGRFDASPNLALLMGESQPRDVAWPEWLERIHRDDRGIASCDKLLEPEAEGESVEFRFYDGDNRMRWARCQRVVAGDAIGHPVVCGVVVDVTEERERTAALEAEATRDSLTGLLNRRGLKHAMAAPLPSDTALVMVDLDGLKQINDTFGHVTGDAVLVAAAERLAAAVVGAKVARLGGDEFLAFVPAATVEEACQIRRHVARALTFIHEDLGKRLPVRASVGFAWARAGCRATEFLGEADDDLYHNKRTRKAAARAALRKGGEKDFTAMSGAVAA